MNSTFKASPAPLKWVSDWLINPQTHYLEQPEWFPECSYQFLPLHKGAVITRKEWGSATPLPTDSRGWQYIWLTVRTKQEDPTELFFLLLWPSPFCLSPTTASRWGAHLEERLTYTADHQGPSSFVSETNDLSVVESGSRRKPISKNFQIIW